MTNDKVERAVANLLGSESFARSRKEASSRSTGSVIKTGIHVLDEIKAYRVRLGHAVEVVGASQSGKTQMLHLIAAHAVVRRKSPSGGVRVCWFDLNGGLDLARIGQLVMLAGGGEYQGADMSSCNVSGLQVYHSDSTLALSSALHKLPEFLQSPEGASVDTIIIDSLGSFHYRDKQEAGSPSPLAEKPKEGLSTLSNELILTRIIADLLKQKRFVLYVSRCALFGEESLPASWPFPGAGIPSAPSDFMPSMWRSIISHVLLIYKVQQGDLHKSDYRAVVSLVQKQGSNQQKVIVQAAGTILIEKEGIRTTGDLHVV